MEQPCEERVYLRALEESDAVRTLSWHNDQALYSDLVGGFRFVSHLAELEWIRRRVAYSETSISLAVCLKGSDEHIGNAYLMEIDMKNRHAQIGMLIGSPSARGKGYGTCAVRLTLRHAFQDLGFNRVHLTVLAHNAPAIRVYEKCGFVHEGCLRRHAFKNGDYRDLIAMGVLREEFEEADRRLSEVQKDT